MNESGITEITFTYGGRPATVTPAGLSRLARELRMPAATATMTRIGVPTIEQFDGAEYLPAPELEAVLTDLIASYPNSIGHLTRVNVAVLWRAKGGKSKGKAKFGQCQKPSGLLAFFAEDIEFVITVSADHCRDAEYDTAQLRPLVYHEALHIGVIEGEDGADDTFALVGHDIETFVAEIRDMGAWHEMLTATADAFNQAGLFG